MSTLDPSAHISAPHRLLKALTSFLTWSLPLKLALGGIAAALGSAGFLGFVSEYATYWYSIYYGFRPPAEGAPYLRAAVSLAGLLLPLTSALVFVLVHLLVRFYRWQLRSGFFFGVIDVAPMLPKGKWWVLGFVLLSMAGTLIGVAIGEITMPGDLPNKLGVSVRTAWLLLFAAEGLFTFLVAVAFFAPHWVTAAGVGVTLVYIALWCVVLFTPRYYSGFLRLVGYGGGLPVLVEHADGKDTLRATDGYLMMRTTDALILYVEPPGFVEIPQKEISRVSHSVGGLSALRHKLPPH